MRRLQFKIDEDKIWAIHISDDVDLRKPSELRKAIKSGVEQENTTIENLFFEHMKLVCSECGISLNCEYEKEDGRCSQCDAVVSKKDIGE